MKRAKLLKLATQNRCAAAKMSRWLHAVKWCGTPCRPPHFYRKKVFPHACWICSRWRLLMKVLYARLPQRQRAIVTVEEHSIFGGLGEMTAHIVAESVPVRMKLMGFPDEACRVGKQEDLLCAYGLTAAHIAGQAEALMRR